VKVRKKAHGKKKKKLKIPGSRSELGKRTWFASEG